MGLPSALMAALEEVVLVGVGSRSSAACHTQLGEDVLEVSTHRVLADDQGRRDLAVRFPGGNLLEDLTLSGGKPRGFVSVRLGRAGDAACEGGEPLQVRARAQSGEGVPGIVELERRRCPVAQSRTREPDQDSPVRYAATKAQRGALSGDFGVTP